MPCRGKCHAEKSIRAATYDQLNSKCTTCGKSMDTLDKRCYCCGNPLRRRRNKILDHRSDMNKQRRMIMKSVA